MKSNRGYGSDVLPTGNRVLFDYFNAEAFKLKTSVSNYHP